MGKEENSAAAVSKEINEARLQTAVAILSHAPAEKRDTIITNMLAMLFIFGSKNTESVAISEVQENIDVLKRYISEENAKILMEAVGYSQEKDMIILNSTGREISIRIQYLYDRFKDDLLGVDIEKAREEFAAKLKAGAIIKSLQMSLTNPDMPFRLSQKMKRIPEGALLTEGTIVLIADRLTFRSVDNIRWRDESLFARFQPGTYIKIYKIGTGLEVRRGRN